MVFCPAYVRSISRRSCPVSGLLYLVPQSVFSENTTYAFGFAAVSLGQPAYLFYTIPGNGLSDGRSIDYASKLFDGLTMLRLKFKGRGRETQIKSCEKEFHHEGSQEN